MSSLILSLIVFVVVLGGAFFGALLRNVLPERVFTDDSKDVIKLGTGLVGTLAALVLGLLVATAKGSYDAQSSYVRQIVSDLILLDQSLAHYGTEARGARESLRAAIGPMRDHIWRENNPGADRRIPFEATAEGSAAYDSLAQLSPQDDSQRRLKARRRTSRQIWARRARCFSSRGLTGFRRHSW